MQGGAMELDFKFTKEGLIPAIIQQAESDQDTPRGRVIMMAWMNEASLKKTLETGFMHYWSRSRSKLWLKGESSGHTQRVIRWYADCDADALLFEVEQIGGACHTGYASCFFQELDKTGSKLSVKEEKVFDDSEVYK